MSTVEREAAKLPQVWDRKSDQVAQYADRMDDRARVALMIAKSGLTRHKTPAAVGTIMLAAQEMGIPLMQALNGMYVVDGGMGMEGQLMLALAIQRCGVTLKVLERSEAAFRGVLKRPGWDELSIEFSDEDALRAGLLVKRDGKLVGARGKQTYDKHRPDMLQWRAVAAGLRLIAPDYFAFVYSMDEAVVFGGQDEDPSQASQELHTLMGHEVDPETHAHILEPDEIEGLGRILDAAVDRELIDKAERTRIMDRAVKGEEGVREDLQAIKGKLDAESFPPTPEEAERLRTLVGECRKAETLNENEADEAEFMLDMGNGEGVRIMIADLEKRTAA